jgi:site-specific recombinase XerD
MTNLSPINDKITKTDPQLLVEMRDIGQNIRAKNTMKAYKSDLKDFAQFCEDNGLQFFPATPDILALYLTFLARHAKWNTIKRRVAAISVVHRVKKVPSPVNEDIRELMQGIKRKIGEEVDRKEPLLLEHIQKMVALTDDELKGLRDRALILLGYVTWLRRENLCELEVADISFLKKGILVKVRKEKQDQTRKGREVFVGYGQNPETCPVKALREWFGAAGIKSGKVFRSIDRFGNINGSLSGEGIRLILKKYALEIGLNPEKIAPHSLRAGGATQAIINNMPFDAAQDYGGWKSANIFKGYIRRGKNIQATEYLGV